MGGLSPLETLERSLGAVRNAQVFCDAADGDDSVIEKVQEQALSKMVNTTQKVIDQTDRLPLMFPERTVIW